MRITIKPPSPTPPALRLGALLTVRVEAADPAALLSGPPTVAYEGRYTASPAPAFLFPAPGNDAPGASMRTNAASDFRTPVATIRNPYVDVDAAPGDTITATLLAGGKAYTAALTAPAPGNNPPSPRPVVLQLVEGGAAPPQPPTPQPAPGLTITPDPGDPDVLNLDPAPGNDNIVVEN